MGVVYMIIGICVMYLLMLGDGLLVGFGEYGCAQIGLVIVVVEVEDLELCVVG